MYKSFFKRLLDLIGCILLLPIILPIILIYGSLIKYEDKGPMFYLSDRLGKNGKTFKMLKLRSMKVNAPDLRNPDGSTFCSSSDSRLTKWGKFVREKSIDELPQIINILLGDMSFIGPRPDLPEALFLYNKDERRKIDVKPGITGYSQAYYRNSIMMNDKFIIDVTYIENLSLLLDIKIVFKTISVLLSRKNVFHID